MSTSPGCTPYWDDECVRIDSADGTGIKSVISVQYNAAISAVEIRACIPMTNGPTLAERIGRSPISMSLHHPLSDTDRRCKVHFETATLAFPFECRVGEIVTEVVVLRGVRVEME